MQTTITEALADIKTIGKRLAAKREFVKRYCARHEIMFDPLSAQGGSAQAIKEERQAIADLEERIVRIRLAIAQANATNLVTIENEVRSIAGWLTWRRDVLPGRLDFLKVVSAQLDAVRKEAKSKNMTIVKEPSAQPAPENVIVNLDELELSKQAEKLQTIVGTLDGRLSLLNATILIDV